MRELLDALDRRSGYLRARQLPAKWKADVKGAVLRGWIELDRGRLELTDAGAVELNRLQELEPWSDLCRNGHKMLPENTYIRPSSGQRECRSCRREGKERERAGIAADPSATLSRMTEPLEA